MKKNRLSRLAGAVVLVCLSLNAAAEWENIGENARSRGFADSNVRRNGSVATLWVMYDYKTVQESARSGRKYLSEKDQVEVDCVSERSRAIFFSWHAGSMGDGVVVYTRNVPANWEPTSAPGSYGSRIWKFACSKS